MYCNILIQGVWLNSSILRYWCKRWSISSKLFRGDICQKQTWTMSPVLKEGINPTLYVTNTAAIALNSSINLLTVISFDIVLSL